MKDQYVYNKVVEALKKRNVDPAKNALTQVDGALQGEVTGYKRIYLDAVPHGQCVHDHAHNFNLGIGVAYKTVKFAKKMLKHLQTTNVYINDSPKRLKAFHLIQRRGNLNEDAPTKVCPSRWSSECTLPNSLQFVIVRWDFADLQKAWTRQSRQAGTKMDFLENYGRRSATARGFYKRETSFEYVYASAVFSDIHECLQILMEQLQSVADNQLPTEAYLQTTCDWLQTRVIDGDTIPGGAHLEQFYNSPSFTICNTEGGCKFTYSGPTDRCCPC